MSASRLLRTVAVEHRAIECRRSFDEVHRALISILPALKPELGEMLARADAGMIAQAREEWPKLWLFLMRDHGELTAADGLKAKAMQYEIGNPLTAERMTRHVLAAGLYAPLRVILFEEADGRVFFEFDQPASLFGQFGDDKGTNPEELLAAAHAGCFTMAVAFALQTAGYTPTLLNTDAAVTIETEGGSYRISRSALTLRGTVPAISPEEFLTIVDTAKQNCPVSKVLNAEITLDAALV